MALVNTRFAPSPTGPLHLGHAYSAILAHDFARNLGGRFLLRIEDIDQSRAKAHWITQIYEDLAWLGLNWDEAPLLQSDRKAHYRQALESLQAKGLLYPCFCNRKDILHAASAPQDGAPLIGPDGIVYPGTCRPPDAKPFPPITDTALRLNMRKSARSPLSFCETGRGPGGETGLIAVTPETLIHDIGDIVLARRDMGTSYHLSVVLDDAAQGITHVLRGADLFDATKIHVLLQQIFELPPLLYHHHALIRDENNKRLAKRDDARAIAKYRDDGYSPADIRKMVGL